MNTLDAGHLEPTRSTPEPIASTDLISVIVPVRDNPEGIRELLDRLAGQTLPEDRFEIVIGDDGSRPESRPRIEADHRIRVVAGPPKTSYAGRNRAVEAARGSVLAFCDSDCSPDPTWLEKGLEAMALADVVAGEVIFDPPPRPTVWSLLTMDMFLDQERNVQRFTAVTANLFGRRAWFEKVGGFDDSLPSGGDYDFTRRAASRGARLAHAPAAVVRHPTLDGWRPFLRKVWFTNRWSAVRKARSGLRPKMISLLTFVPFFGIALARRQAIRPIASLHRPRLVSAGLDPGWREDLRAMPLLYLVVAYVAGLARVRGWLEAGSRRGPPESPGGTVARPNPARTARSGWIPQGLTSTRDGALPNLIVVGAQKCGTSALHYYLALHPEICMSRPKELNFFIEKSNWQRGIQWYKQHFDSAASVRGESSPNYTTFPMSDGVPERMASVIPEVRIVYIVRDPLERIASHWVHNYAKRREKGDLRTTLLHPATSYVARSQYHLQLQRFCAYFSKEQILVIDNHDLQHRRLYTLRCLFEFVGVNSDFFHPGFERAQHRSSAKRRRTRLGSSILGLARTSAGRSLPRSVWWGLEAVLPLSGPVGPSPEVRDALGEEVLELLRDDADRLREFTGFAFADWSV